jgi:hypothetical protein
MFPSAGAPLGLADADGDWEAEGLSDSDAELLGETDADGD